MSKSDLIGLRRPPYAFTEEGIAMLSGILNSEIAITINIQIIEAFITMRKYISSSLIDQKFSIRTRRKIKTSRKYIF